MRAATAAVDGQILLKDLTPAAIAAIRSQLGVPNPELIKGRITGKEPDPSVPRWISFLQENADGSVTAPRGAIRIIRQVLHSQRQPLQIKDNRSFGSSLELKPLDGLRDYQRQGAYELLSRGQGLGILPCGGGKTIMALGALSLIKRTTLVVVPTRDLVEQWAESAEGHLGVKPQILGAGKHDIGPFTIATKDALSYHRERLDLSSFGVCVVDEAHQVPTKIFQRLMHHIPAAWRLGLTATPDRPDGLGKLVELSFGERLVERSVPELLRDGWLVLPEVIGIPTTFEYDLPPWEERYMKDYHRMTNAIVTDHRRNKQLVDLICQQTQPTLVLSNRKDHCQKLAEMANRRGLGSIEVLTSDKGKKHRNDALRRMRKGELQTIVATSLADQGLDIRRLTIGILALPERSPLQLTQRAGRFMRPFGHKQAKLYDIVDSRVQNLRNRWAQRCRVYRALGIKPRLEEPLLEQAYGT
jgi:superfamily II DNA or RNA helicase